MTRLHLLAALALSGGVSALQIPLRLPISTPWSVGDVPADTGKDRPLVDTEALQALISADALKKRAGILYNIAEKSEEEYGHPTRVIGSTGELPQEGLPRLELERALTRCKATRGRSTTSHTPSPRWAPTTT